MMGVAHEVGGLGGCGWEFVFSQDAVKTWRQGLWLPCGDELWQEAGAALGPFPSPIHLHHQRDL